MVFSSRFFPLYLLQLGLNETCKLQVVDLQLTTTTKQASQLLHGIALNTLTTTPCDLINIVYTCQDVEEAEAAVAAGGRDQSPSNIY